MSLTFGFLVIDETRTTIFGFSGDFGDRSEIPTELNHGTDLDRNA
jgi:hypothetical protein